MGRRITVALAALALTAAGGCGAAVIGHGAVGSRPAVGAGSPVPASGTPAVPAVATGSVTGSGAQLAADPRADTVLAAARHDVEVVSSYDYRRLDEALARGLAVSTGAFREQYRTAFATIRSTATGGHLVQRASVTAAGLGPAAADRATVLVFGQTTSTGTAARGDHTDPFTARVDLTRVGSAWLIDGFTLDGAIDGSAPGSPALAAAVAAARAGTAAVLTYRRATFAADFARALVRTTGRLRTELAAKRADTLDAMTGGRFDLVGATPAAGVVSADADVVVVLVEATETQTGPGRTPVTTPQRLRVTVRSVGGSWRVSDAAAVGLR